MSAKANADSLAALREMLAKADHLGSLREVAETLVPERRHTLLRRAAIPVVFDESMAREILAANLSSSAPGSTDSDIAWLLAHPDVERLGDRDPLFRMRAAVRAARLDRWFAPNERAPAYVDVVDGIALSQAIVDKLTTDDGAVRSGWQIEHLYHLAMADPAAAARRIETLYRAADADFDVPSCYRVLQAVGGQRALLVRHRDQRDQPTERRQAITRLLETHDALQQYYEARCAFAADLAKSAHALERQFMREEWDRIQRINTTSASSVNTQERDWIIDLTAQGGMGKTIFLQWLAARKCVPNRVPYARIDFDFTDPTVLPEAPWLVLVRLAQQLNSQIAGRPFSGFIEKYDEYASIARDLAVEGRGQHTGEFLDVTGEHRLARQVTDDFADTLRETVGGAVVVVLDTLEDVIRRRTTNLLAVITCLSKVHDAYPNLRLVLAGRFDLRDDSKLKGFATDFGAVTRSVQVRRFDLDESVRYLVAVRGLPDNDAVRAMAECSRGLPFALSLYADEWQLGGAMTADEVRASPNPELKYLVNRVLRRIEASDQALCWLLRYGVVPRQLTKSFAREVLLPELELALGGESPHDDPSRDPTALHPYYAEQSAPASAVIDLDDLWARLEAYASTLSFVRADADRDTVVFHEDAVRPMRRELQRQPVFRRLQERAASYYARLARETEREDANRWARATRAMLFHRFQLGGAEAERAWRRAMRAATRKRDVRLVFEIATELTQPEYLDDDRQPIVREDGSLAISATLLRDALIAKGQAALQLGSSSAGVGDVDWWVEAERALDDLAALGAREPALDINLGTVAVMRAQVDARYGKGDDALARLESVRSTMTSPQDRFELSVALGGVLAIREEPAAIDHLTEAIALGEALASVEPHRIIELRQLLATQCAAHDRYDLAVEQLIVVRNRLRRGSIDRCQCTARLAEVLLASDEPRQALGAARNAAGDCDAALAALPPNAATGDRSSWLALRAELEVLEARALVTGGEPEQALAKADAAMASAGQLGSLQPGGAAADMLAAVAQARARSVRGVILAARGRHGPALDELETARQLWAQGVKRVEQSASDLCRKVAVLLHRVGNLKMAEQHLNEADRITLPTRGESWTMLRIAAARLDQARGHSADALRSLEASYPPSERRVPRLDARVAVTALSMSEHPAYAEMLQQAVRRITPVGAARQCLAQSLPDLEPLEPLAGLGSIGNEIADRIGVRFDQAASRAKSLSAWARLDRARIARALGATEDAKRWLASVTANALARASAPTVAFAHFLECELQVPDAARQTRDARRALIANPGDARMLAGIVACREASRLAAAGRRDEARALADVAATLLNSPGEPVNVWAARCDALRAELATTDDDFKHFLAEAISRYDALDQDVAAAELRQRRGPQTFEETVSRDRPPLVLRVSVDGTDVSGELSAERDGAVAERFALRGELSGTLEHLRSDLEAARAQAIPYQLSRLLADEWTSTIRDLGALFGPRAFWQSSLGDSSERADANVDVRLDIQSPIVDALPLECFSDSGDEPGFLAIDRRVGTLYRSVRVSDARRTHATWVQRALSEIGGTRIFADGIEGPQTRGAISAFQTAVGLTPTGEADGATSALLFDRLRRLHNGDAPLRALVLAPAPDLARPIGAEEEAAADRLARIYEEAGFETTVREGVTVADLRNLCTELHPEVIHVRAPLRESASLGGIVLDARASGMSESAASARGDALTPSGVTRALGQTRWPDRPIVVLDPSRGRGRTQAMHQMLLRNGFAADLFRQGTTVAVLGVGLGEPDEHARITRTIAESLAHGRSLSELVAELRENRATGRLRPVDMTFETMLPTVGVALWAFDPNLVYLAPPGPSRRTTTS